jgi:Fe2+ or Zn2+ uptake regulation protein
MIKNVKKKSSTQEDITLRRQILLQIITKMKKDGQTVNRFTVLPHLKKAGFDVEEGTVYRDLTALNRENNWVRDLAESNYSAYQEDIALGLDWIITEAKKQYEKKWTQSKRIIKQLPRGKKLVTIEENTITTELAQPKAAFLAIIAKAHELKMKHTNGENINISAALISAEFKELKKKYAEQGIDLDSPVNIIELAKKR